MTQTILNVDCRHGLRSIADNVFHLCVTSPPYKNVDGFNDDLMRGVFAEVYRTMRDRALFFLNFGHLAEDKFRPFRVCRLAMDAGFGLNETIIWVKNHYKPIQGKRRLNNLTEFVFMLHKGRMPVLDRLAIGIPYKDKSNVGRFAEKDLRCAGNVWNIPYETIQRSAQKSHHDRFPVELPLRCIKLTGLEHGTVLDPFAGSATTAVAAKQCGWHSIGFEVRKNVYEQAKARIAF